jgi:hypothetical protein
MARFTSLFAACGLFAALGGCAYDDGYGYGGVSMGYGGGYGPYDPYGYYGYGGWYDGYYYPGTGYYIYDRGGKRYRWNDRQRAYWERRRTEWREHGGDRPRDGVPGNGAHPGNNDGQRPDRNRWPSRGGDRPAWNGSTGNATPAPTPRQDGGTARPERWQWRNEGRNAPATGGSVAPDRGNRSQARPQGAAPAPRAAPQAGAAAAPRSRGRR